MYSFDPETAKHYKFTEHAYSFFTNVTVSEVDLVRISLKRSETKNYLRSSKKSIRITWDFPIGNWAVRGLDKVIRCFSNFISLADHFHKYHRENCETELGDPGKLLINRTHRMQFRQLHGLNMTHLQHHVRRWFQVLEIASSHLAISQPAFISSKLTIETLEQDMKYVVWLEWKKYIVEQLFRGKRLIGCFWTWSE